MKGILHTSPYQKIILILMFPTLIVIGFLVASGLINWVLLLLLGLNFTILALISPQLALILAVPLQLSASLGYLRLSETQIFGVNLQSITLLALLIAIVARLITKKNDWKTTELDKPLLIFFFVVPLMWSFWDRGNLVIPDYDHLAAVKQVGFYVLNFFVALNSNMDERWLKRLLLALAIIALFVIGRDMWLFYQSGGFTSLNWRLGRLAETMGLKIFGGNTLVQGVFLAVAFSQVLTKQRAGTALLWSLVGMLSLVDIFLSFYRSAFLMVAVIVIITIFSLQIRRGIPILFLFALVAITLVPSSVSERISYTFSAGNESVGSVMLNTTGRLSYFWPRSWNVAMQYFPFGTGYLQVPIARGDGYTSFNQFLHWFAEFGLLGLAAALWMIFSISRYLWLAISLPQSLFLKAYYVGLLSAWGGILVRNVTGEAFSYIWLAVFMLLLGAGAGCLPKPQNLVISATRI